MWTYFSCKAVTFSKIVTHPWSLTTYEAITARFTNTTLTKSSLRTRCTAISTTGKNIQHLLLVHLNPADPVVQCCRVVLMDQQHPWHLVHLLLPTHPHIYTNQWLLDRFCNSQEIHPLQGLPMDLLGLDLPMCQANTSAENDRLSQSMRVLQEVQEDQLVQWILDLPVSKHNLTKSTHVGMQLFLQFVLVHQDDLIHPKNPTQMQDVDDLFYHIAYTSHYPISTFSRLARMATSTRRTLWTTKSLPFAPSSINEINSVLFCLVLQPLPEDLVLRRHPTKMTTWKLMIHDTNQLSYLPSHHVHLMHRLDLECQVYPFKQYRLVNKLTSQQQFTQISQTRTPMI